jgi:hypothetical protein
MNVCYNYRVPMFANKAVIFGALVVSAALSAAPSR